MHAAFYNLLSISNDVPSTLTALLRRHFNSRVNSVRTACHPAANQMSRIRHLLLLETET